MAEHQKVPRAVDRQDPQADDLSGQFGRYRIVKKLGEGGMGAVYLAHDTQLERQVALKVPRFSAQDSPQAMERFLREARLAATLHHPNVCPIHDVGRVGDTPYLTMAYIEGHPLSTFIRPDKPLPAKHVAVVVRKLAMALQDAHEHGIIHRDLKPSNIMIDRRHEPVIMDFGLARRAEASESHLTQAGSLLGTPAYMSPEQVLGQPEELGPQTDIYSLGVILYEMLSGRVPFEGPPAAVIGQILTVEPPPPQQYRADLDPALAAICLKAMSKSRQQRYGSMKELAAALGEYLRQATPSASGPFPAIAPPPIPPSPGMTVARNAPTLFAGVPAASGEQRREARGPRRRPLVATVARNPKSLGIVVAVVAAVAISLLALTLNTTTSHQPASARKTSQPKPPPDSTRKESVAGPDGALHGPYDLFDGRTLQGWHAIGGGKWTVEDGVIVGRKERLEPAGVLVSDAQFGDFELQLKFQLFFGNSGVYFRCQEGGWAGVSGLEANLGPRVMGHLEEVFASAENGSGERCLDAKRLGPLRDYYRGDEWNDLTITAEGGRVSVLLNGVTTASVTAAPQAPEGHLALELSGQRAIVMFKDLRLRRIENTAAKTAASGSAAEPSVAAGLCWLARHQLADGGWSFDHTQAAGCGGKCGNPGTMTGARSAATALALLPFLYPGQTHQHGDYQGTVKKGLDFLLNRVAQTVVGARFLEEGGTMYSHGMASLALCVAYERTRDPKLQKPTQDAVDYIVYAQDPAAGGWRYQPRDGSDTSVSGWQITALVSGQRGGLRVPEETLTKASAFLDSVEADGGARYAYMRGDTPRSRACTAIGLLCRMLMGMERTHPGLTRGIEQLSAQSPMPQEVYANYYSSLALRAYGGEPWNKWYPAMRDSLRRAQAQQGHEAGSWYFDSGDLGLAAGGRLYATAMALMTQELLSRPLWPDDKATK